METGDVGLWLQADIQSPEIEVRFSPTSRHPAARNWSLLYPPKRTLSQHARETRSLPFQGQPAPHSAGMVRSFGTIPWMPRISRNAVGVAATIRA